MISVVQLAERWTLSPKQVFERALQRHFWLYFEFEGLVFDWADDWLRSNKGVEVLRQRDAARENVASYESFLRRRLRGELDEFESLGAEDADIVKGRLIEHRKVLATLTEQLQQRDLARIRQEFRGYVRATPAMMWDLQRLGRATHPLAAYRAQGEITLVRRADGTVVWDGPLIALEPSPGCEHFDRAELTPVDLLADMVAIKALEDRALESVQSAATVAAPVSKWRAQDREILRLVKEAGFDPAALPIVTGRQLGAKAAARDLAKIPSPVFQSKKAFDLAWERLRASRDLRDLAK